MFQDSVPAGSYNDPFLSSVWTMSNKCCSGTGKEGKTKEVVKDREVKTVVCDKVECERWCVTKKDGVCVTKQCVKDGVCV